MQKSMRERNYHMYCLLLLADVVHYLVTSAAYRRTHLLCRHWTINRSPHQHSSRHWLEAPAGSSTKKLAATSGRRHWPICWCCPDRGPGSFDVEDATTLSWSSAAVSEWVSGLGCDVKWLLLDADELKQLISAAADCNVSFVYALSPGLDIVYTSSSDVSALKAKLDQVFCVTWIP